MYNVEELKMKIEVLFIVFLSALSGLVSADSCGDLELGDTCLDDLSVIETILLFPYSVMWRPPPSPPPKPGGYVDYAADKMNDAYTKLSTTLLELSVSENIGSSVEDVCVWIENTLTVTAPRKLSQWLETIQEFGSNVYIQRHDALMDLIKRVFQWLADAVNSSWSILSDLGETKVAVLILDVTAFIEDAVDIILVETSDMWKQTTELWRQSEVQVGTPVLYVIVATAFITVAAIASWKSRISKLNKKLEMIAAVKADRRRENIYKRPKNINHNLLFEAIGKGTDDGNRQWADSDDKCTVWVAHGDSLEGDTTPNLTRRLSPIIETKDSCSNPRLGYTSDTMKRIQTPSPISMSSDISTSPIHYDDSESPRRTAGRSGSLFQQYQPRPQMFTDNEVDLMDVTADSDIGDPCCNSSFIEDMEKRYKKSPNRFANGMGDGVSPARRRPKGILTKRWPKEELGLSFTQDTSQVTEETERTVDNDVDVDVENNSQIDVSNLNKSLSLYGGSNMPLQEMAVVYVVQSVWNWAKKYISRRSGSASKPSSGDCSRGSSSFRREHNRSKEYWNTHSLRNSRNHHNKSQNCADEVESESVCMKQASLANSCNLSQKQELIMNRSNPTAYSDEYNSLKYKSTDVLSSGKNTCNVCVATDGDHNESSDGPLLSFSDYDELDDEIITGDSSLYGEYCCPNIQNARIVHVPLIENKFELENQVVKEDFPNEIEDKEDGISAPPDYGMDMKKIAQLQKDLNMLEEQTEKDIGYLDEIEDIFMDGNHYTDMV